MDTARGHQARSDAGPDPTDAGVGEATIEIGTDERRMHVRAYNHWVSLLKGRAYPSIEDLDPAGIADFGPHSLLLDFTAGIDDPAIPFLGAALRQECAVDQSITHISEVPARSLLSRLTDHYLQIIANRAPIGFEAEFVGMRGHLMMYRGILMPFSSDGARIDFIYGVINWKEVVDAATQAELSAELAAAVAAAPGTPAEPAAVWADGPSAGAASPAAPDALADRLGLAREGADAVRTADRRTRAALYHALGLAHEFACAIPADEAGYRELLADAGVKAQARAPMTPVVKLVFGADYDKTRLTEFAAVLAHAERQAIAPGRLVAFLERFAGGIKGVVAAERLERRPARKPAARPIRLDRRPALGAVALDVAAGAGAVLVLVARACGNGTFDVLGAVDERRIVAGAVRRLR